MIKSHLRQFLNTFIFPGLFICLTDLLSDFLPELVIIKKPMPNASYNFVHKGHIAVMYQIKSKEESLEKKSKTKPVVDPQRD